MANHTVMKKTKNSQPFHPVICIDRRLISVPAFVLLGYILLTVLILRNDESPLRIGFAIFLSVLGSGASTVTVLFPRKNDLDFTERLALSACFSMTVGGIAGFALARSPWGLRALSFLFTSGVYNLICFGLTWYRRRNHEDEERFFRLDLGKLLGWVKNDQRISSRAVTTILVIIFLSGAWFLAQKIRQPSLDPPMTEFYLLGKGGETNSYPQTCYPGETVDVSYGIVNRENQSVTYQIKVFTQGTEIGKSLPIQLFVDETQKGHLQFRVPETMSGLTKVEFILYRETKPYRFLHLWINVVKP